MYPSKNRIYGTAVTLNEINATDVPNKPKLYNVNMLNADLKMSQLVILI